MVVLDETVIESAVDEIGRSSVLHDYMTLHRRMISPSRDRALAADRHKAQGPFLRRERRCNKRRRGV